MNPANITVILHCPGYSENIGSAARAMCNMGLVNLAVVSPGSWNRDRASKLATHRARPILDAMVFYDTLEDALSEIDFSAATSARLGGMRQVTPVRDMAPALAALSLENRVGIVFGPEDRGLTNQEVNLCQALITIPSADFSSLNLAQAVMVVCYELFTAGGDASLPPAPRLAGPAERDLLHGEVHSLLEDIGYTNPENPDYWRLRIKHSLDRLLLRAGEVSILRGIIRQIRSTGCLKSQGSGENR